MHSALPVAIGKAAKGVIMAKSEKNHKLVMTLTFGGILTAIVVVLQLLGSFIRFGPFSVSLVLLPIIIGAAMFGPALSTWLGFVFGVTVLLSGDAAAFLAINVGGTVATVLVKGALAGLAAGIVFTLLKKVNRYFAVAVAAVACPVVNTGIFLLGCRLFFFETVSEWAAGSNQTSVFVYMIVGLVGFNFLFELGTNIILSPVIVRILNAVKGRAKKEDAAPETADDISI